jgi:hypothetical protein
MSLDSSELRHSKAERHCTQLSRHSSMDAGIQSQGCAQAYAILGFWIAAIPAKMT